MNDALRIPLRMGLGITLNYLLQEGCVGAAEQLSPEKAQEMAQSRPGS